MGKGCKSASHQLFKDKARNRVDDLQEKFTDLQSAIKESRVFFSFSRALVPGCHPTIDIWRGPASRCPSLHPPLPPSLLPLSRHSGREMDAEENAIEKAAAERRERLKTLKMAKVLLETPDDDTKKRDRNLEDAEDTEEDEVPSMKFRNYLPHDKQLQEGKLAPVVLPKFEDPVAAVPLAPEKIEDPFLNIAPKKPNWDLRRDVQKKLDKLEKRTQKALYELAKEQEN